MTPKEKAKDLIERFMALNGNSFFAKDNALLCVEEIIQSFPSHFEVIDKGKIVLTVNDKFWKEVKSEIEKK